MAITARSMQNYQVEIRAGNHRLIADEPLGIGDDTGPSPFQLLLSALASCTVITLHMYANRKGWLLEKVEVSCDIQSMEIRAQDGSKSRSSIIDCLLTIHGNLTEEQLRRLEEIASRCPIHRTLSGQINIRTRVTQAETGVS